MIKKNDEIVLEICDYTTDGSGVGRFEGMAVFVPLTAVGDTARVKILKVKKTYAYGKLIELIEKSQNRQDDTCSAFSRCGGCAYRHITYEAEKALKTQKVYETIKRIGGVDLEPQPILFDNDCRYRNKAQYPVGPDGKVGFYAFHSHRIIPCDDCLLQPEIFGILTAVTEKWIKENNISIYNEESHSGLLRHIYIRKADKTGEIMFTAVINGRRLPFADKLVEELRLVAGEDLKSVMININTLDTNVILGNECICLFGSPYITDILCGVRVRLSALSFYQVNRTMAEKLYKKAAEYACPQGKTVLDLYCGAGTIGLSMANEAKEIIGVEIIPQAVEDAKFNAKENGIENARFLCADAAAAAEQLAKENLTPDVVIVDPPRKGCSEDLIEIITQKFAPERVVYVSCDPATLARDIKIFGSMGYTLAEYTPADLFPKTAHVECCALLSKNNCKSID